MERGAVTNHHPLGMLLKDAIFGVNDGTVSMLALIAGLSAAAMSHQVIIISAFAEAFAGALSMAFGSYISTKSQMEFLKHELRGESLAVQRKPRLEKQHLVDIYKRKGFSGKELEKIVAQIMSNRGVWEDVMQREELGFSKTILQSPLQGGLVMFFSFLVASFIPLLPFLYTTIGHLAFSIALFNGIVLLFVVGVGKTSFTGRHPLRSGLEMVVVGGIATALAYGVGTYLPLLWT